MGTRNLTMVKVGGKTKIAQYGQWDGYPTGQGKVVAEFIHHHMDLAKFKAKVESLKWASKAKIKKTWTEAGADPESSSVSFAIADKHSKMYPEFSRDTCADILRLVQDGVLQKTDWVDRNGDYIQLNIETSGYDVTHVENERSFLKSDWGCEYAYELDLDKRTVTVYVGGSKYKTFTFKQFTPSFMELLEKQINEEAA